MIRLGVIGDPIIQSKSPSMHQAALKAIGLKGTYEAYHVTTQDLYKKLEYFEMNEYRGFNITIPHKEHLSDWVDQQDEYAYYAQAINTVVFERGKRLGFNTDGIGYVRSFTEETNLNFQNKSILILGAGGAAKGILYPILQQSPKQVFIYNRTTARAKTIQTLYSSYPVQMVSEIKGLEQEVEIVINTTSVGMFPHVEQTPLQLDFFRPHMCVSDLIYNPRQTLFLQQAQKQGCLTHSGWGMFIYQGAYAFEKFTGYQAPIEAMKNAMTE